MAVTPAVATTASQQARRARIIDAARELLEEREYDRIQMRDVAVAADVALGTLYRYFRSKEQLFANVLLEWSRGFETIVRERSATASTDDQRLLVALRRAVSAFERHPHFFRLLAVLEVVSDSEVEGPYREYADRFGRVLADALSGIHEDDAAVIAAASSAVLSSLLRSWSIGQITIGSVYDQLDRWVQLLFGSPRSIA